MQQLFTTNSDLGLFIIRVALGAVIFAHGAQKLLGWFGGYGYSGTMGFFTQTVGLPYIVGLLVIAIEFFGGLALIGGVAARPAALGVIAVMIGAVATSHLAHGFFMNWSGAQKGEGFEFHVVYVAAALAVLIGGAGRWSLDGAIAKAIGN